MRAPGFWYGQDGEETLKRDLWSKVLSPLGRLYAWGGRMRTQRTEAFEAPVPVICVGNLTAGGTGKTPLTMTIAKELIGQGERPVILTRGYGGQEEGPIHVKKGEHTAKHVGDEALLLARTAPTVVSRNRAKGAELAIQDGKASVILMDDGFQNPGLKKDFCIVVVDSETGFGNGRVIPAGPLREPIEEGLARAHAIVMMGNVMAAQDSDRLALTKARAPLFNARLEPKPAQEVYRQKVFAFAGIGHPQKFFNTAKALGYRLLETKSFPDHHPYTDEELKDLTARAHTLGATLLTTEKDLIRIDRDKRKDIMTLPVEVQVTDMTGFMDLIRRAIQRHRAHVSQTQAQR